MNRRNFLKTVSAAPAGIAAAAVTPQLLLASSAFPIKESVSSFGNQLGQGVYPRYAENLIYKELSHYSSLLDAVRRIRWEQRMWKDAYRDYRFSRWTKPADYRDRDCRLIWRKFGSPSKGLNQAQEYSQEKELALLKKKWAKTPQWLKELATANTEKYKQQMEAKAINCGTR